MRLFKFQSCFSHFTHDWGKCSWQVLMNSWEFWKLKSPQMANLTSLGKTVSWKILLNSGPFPICFIFIHSLISSFHTYRWVKHPSCSMYTICQLGGQTQWLQVKLKGKNQHQISPDKCWQRIGKKTSYYTSFDSSYYHVNFNKKKWHLFMSTKRGIMDMWQSTIKRGPRADVL